MLAPSGTVSLKVRTLDSALPTTAARAPRPRLSVGFIPATNFTLSALSLFVDDEKVGEGTIVTQPGNFSLVGEGLNVGKDPAEPVTDDYPGTSPYAFSGGTIKEAVVDVSGEPFVDLEKEAIAMMARE